MRTRVRPRAAPERSPYLHDDTDKQGKAATERKARGGAGEASSAEKANAGGEEGELDWEDEGKGERTARLTHHPQRKNRHIEAAE